MHRHRWIIAALFLLALHRAFAAPDSEAAGCHESAHSDKTQCEHQTSVQLPPLERDGTFRGRVRWVFDGDTLEVLTNDRPLHVRIARIDAPERTQVYGWSAALALIDLVRDRMLRIRPRGVDRYDRVLADIEIDGRDVGRTLVEQGAAWCYGRRSQNAELCDLERQARAAHRGLWAVGKPIAPVDWRRAHPLPERRSK